MIIWGEAATGLSIVCERGRVRIQSGLARVEIDICGEVVGRQGSVMFWSGARAQLGTNTVEVPVHDPTLTSPTWQDFPILTDPRDGRLMAERLVRAHAWLQRFDPSVAENCAALTGGVLPVRGGRAGTFGSARREEAIGLIFLLQTPAVDILAESLLHEASHQLLFRIDRAAPVVSHDDRVERFYSPWRQDARPLIWSYMEPLFLLGLPPFTLDVPPKSGPRLSGMMQSVDLTAGSAKWNGRSQRSADMVI